MDNTFAPELELTDDERVNLAVVASMPGFQIMQRIFRSAIDTFSIAMINATVGSDEAQIYHQSAKVAAQLYTLFVARVNREVETYVKAPKPSDPPLADITDVLEMGGINYDDAQSFLDNQDIWN